MDEKDIPQLLEQLGDLVIKLEKAMNSPLAGAVSPDVQRRLERVEKLVTRLDDFNSKVLAQAGITDADIQQRLTPEALKDLPNPTRRTLEQAKRLRQQAQEGLNDLTFAIKTSRTMPGNPESDKKASAKRKAKFRRIGSRDKWKPL